MYSLRVLKVETIRIFIHRYLYIVADTCIHDHDHADIQFIHNRQTVEVNIKLGDPLYM